MYEKFFGLSRDPFSIAPDPRYLFMSERHREALAHLLYGLGAGGGFVLLSGEIGTGKTTVCRCFLEQIPANCNVAYIFNPRLTVLELLRSVCEEFQVAVPPEATTAKALIDPLNAFLLDGHSQGRNSVLIIDEAQNLSSDILEQLRLLTNLETSERKLLQIILIGQPELRGMLARPELEQLAQRVIARFHLDALSQVETADYVAHRLSVAGMNAALPFDKKALARIYQLSRGVPRRINLLCGRALLGAYASSQRQIGKTLVDQAAAEVFGNPFEPHKNSSQKHKRRDARRLVPVVMASAIGVAVGAALVGAAGYAWAPGAWPPRMLSSVVSQTQTVDTRLPSPTRLLAASATVNLAASAATSSDREPVVMAVPPLPPSPLPAQPLLSADQFEAALAASSVTENQTWAALGQLWGLSLAGNGNIPVCTAAAAHHVQCYRKSSINLSLIRLLDRPGVLTLNAAGKQPVFVLLTGLTPQTATLQIDGTAHTVPLPLLTDAWAGSFATLWRMAADMPDTSAVGRGLANTAWIGNQLGRLSPNSQALPTDWVNQSGPLEAAVASRINAFQLAQGLPADSQVGPLTLMQLNRAMGASEPRLQKAQP